MHASEMYRLREPSCALNAYDSFELTAVFEKAGQMVIEVMVEEAEATEPHKH